MKQSLRSFCEETIAMLTVAGSRFGSIYVARTMELYGTFKPVKQFGLFSSAHGPDFFEKIIKHLDGEPYLKSNGKPWSKDDEYEHNYINFIKHYSQLEKA